MNVNTTEESFFKSTVLGHPAGLFVLFFTEMWERFSYYGMRALLVLFLTTSTLKGGWEWNIEDAMALYGTYTMVVYFTPIIGGFLADRYLGYRWAVVLGALIMTCGHAAMAVETPLFLYIGITCLMIGNGLFKPNMTSIISNAYEKHPEKKDGAYSLFYMGVNAGAFLGIMLCGYIGEKVSWSLGFGLAGIFMFLGMLQFYFTQNIFGNIGLVPTSASKLASKEKAEQENAAPHIIRDRIIAVIIFSVFSVFFWAAFEQAGGSMTIFAEKFTQRELFGNTALIFKISDALLTITPLIVITYVLIKLFSKTVSEYRLGNSILSLSFILIWGIVIWKINRDFSNPETEVPASWFGILNSLFIICFAPVFSKWWESKYNISGPMKFGLGLALLGLGFGFLAYGSQGIASDSVVRVSMFWLIAAYLFHTLGELCISPVSLSYVSKLVPASWIGIMFGVYYLFLGMGNKLAGSMGGLIESISLRYSLSTFFLIFTIIPVGLGIIMILLSPLMKKLMHGVK